MSIINHRDALHEVTRLYRKPVTVIEVRALDLSLEDLRNGVRKCIIVAYGPKSNPVQLAKIVRDDGDRHSSYLQKFLSSYFYNKCNEVYHRLQTDEGQAEYAYIYSQARIWEASSIEFDSDRLEIYAHFDHLVFGLNYTDQFLLYNVVDNLRNNMEVILIPQKDPYDYDVGILKVSDVKHAHPIIVGTYTRYTDDLQNAQDEVRRTVNQWAEFVHTCLSQDLGQRCLSEDARRKLSELRTGFLKNQTCTNGVFTPFIK